MCIKLTDSNGKTQNETQWGENVTHEVKSPGENLCTNQVIHAYEDEYLAVLLNPIHCNFENPIAWSIKGKVVANDGLKIGLKKLTTVKRVCLPVVTLEQRVRFALLCVQEVLKISRLSIPVWEKWAEDYFTATIPATTTAIDAAHAVIYAAADATTADAARAAAYAVYAATHAADATTADAARAVIYAAAYDAASAAVYAASAAAHHKTKINFKKLAHLACDVK